MKTAKFSIVAVLTLLGVAAGANEKVIELPPAVFSNNRAVEIGKVTLSDTVLPSGLVDKNCFRQLYAGRRQEVHDSMRTGRRPRFVVQKIPTICGRIQSGKCRCGIPEIGFPGADIMKRELLKALDQ